MWLKHTQAGNLPSDPGFSFPQGSMHYAYKVLAEKDHSITATSGREGAAALARRLKDYERMKCLRAFSWAEHLDFTEVFTLHLPQA